LSSAATFRRGTPHGGLSVVVFGHQTIVLAAEQADVAGAVVAAKPEGMPVVELQPVPLGAAPAVLVH